MLSVNLFAATGCPCILYTNKALPKALPLARQGAGLGMRRSSVSAGLVEKWAMRQRKLGSHTPPCHRRMVITTLFSVLLAALQRRPVLYHTRWLLTVGG